MFHFLSGSLFHWTTALSAFLLGLFWAHRLGGGLVFDDSGGIAFTESDWLTELFTLEFVGEFLVAAAAGGFGNGDVEGALALDVLNTAQLGEGLGRSGSWTTTLAGGVTTIGVELGDAAITFHYRNNFKGSLSGFHL